MRLLLTTVLLLVSLQTFGQKTLILEKLNNNTRQIRFHIGDLLTFRTNLNPKVWQTYYIKDLFAEENTLYFENEFIINISDITEVRIPKISKNGKAMGYTFLFFAIPFTTYTGINFATGEDVNAFHYIVGGTAFALAFILPKLKNGRFKMKNNRLRIFSLEGF